MRDNNKINIIYILGTGHCGSTLLEMLIGSSKEVFSSGEIVFFNIFRDVIKGKKENLDYICTCRNKVKECDFWKELNKKEYEIKKYYSLKENRRILWGIITNKSNNKLIDQSSKLFKDILENEAKQNGEIKYIIDSSKDPRRLYTLTSDPKLNVIPIFLYRSNAAIAHSYSKKERRKSKDFWFSLFVRSFFINILSIRLLKMFKRFKVIQYEQFCESPKVSIDEINSFFDIKINREIYIKEILNTAYHSIGGNGLRFKQIKEIRCNLDWNKELSVFRKRVSILLDKIIITNVLKIIKNAKK